MNKLPLDAVVVLSFIINWAKTAISVMATYTVIVTINISAINPTEAAQILMLNK